MLGQASLPVSYNRRFNILKTTIKDSRKAKTMLKENENVLRKSETLWEKVSIHMIEIEKSRKKFKDVGDKKSAFEKGLFAKPKQAAWRKALLLPGNTR